MVMNKLSDIKLKDLPEWQAVKNKELHHETHTYSYNHTAPDLQHGPCLCREQEHKKVPS